MPFRNNSVKQNRLKEVMAKTAHVQMLRAVGVMWACQWLSSDDISKHNKRRKNLIINLRHRQALVLTRPAVLLGEVDQTRESGGNRA